MINVKALPSPCGCFGCRSSLLPPPYFLHIYPQTASTPVPTDNTVGGIRASTASLVFGAKHRFRRHRHKCRAPAIVYAAPAFMHHSFLLSGHARLFILKTQKERRFDGSTKPTSRRSKLCEIFSSKKPPFARDFLVQKGAASDYFARKQKKRGSNHVEPLSDASDIHAQNL